MSTLTVTTVQTANGSTDLTLQTGNTSAAKIVIPASGNPINFTSSVDFYNFIKATTFYNYNDNNVRWTQNELVLRGGAPTIYLRDTDHNSAMIHCNSNLLYILRGGNDTESWSQVNGQWPLYINLTNNDAVFGGSLSATASNTFNLGTSSIAANGYSRLPNGLLMQWGTTATINQDGTGSVTFPIAFSATPYCIQITIRGTKNTGSSGTDSISAQSTTGFTIEHGADGNVTFYWMAIGV